MTERTAGGRVMSVATLARVEGEGAMRVEIRDGAVADVKLRIYEPPRFFEAFLRGRSFAEVPDITARICGICPVAYQTSSVQAMEEICGIEVGGQLRVLGMDDRDVDRVFRTFNVATFDEVRADG